MDLNHETGAPIGGWDHVVQSIGTILGTRLESRVMRREFGSGVPDLVDAPMNEASVLSLFVAVAEAIAAWEPRFELTNIQFEGAADGLITLVLNGEYLPFAHIGDFAIAQDATRTIRVTPDTVSNWSTTA